MSKILAVRHAENIRELGGYKTKDGREIAQHKLIRSASINHLDRQDKKYLAEYGIKKVVDFRSLEERNTQPDQAIPAAENIFCRFFHWKNQRLLRLLRKKCCSECRRGIQPFSKWWRYINIS
ncbi:tyrosine-protein phosphatase [Enterococcus pseudoavium]|uniref:Tyrosine-protein phosphatase n=1 Tax=Enterococcus pseudoavium TaxID=44007 RepID=A0ABU3FL09_9ENTE|nr:tyrosine-protein phosphatase [Enterococcus pseudoavium]MDT2754679.1 tyrosine-protein phosphatase [Enterococcus pseudoavium]MDT2771767.1 tyrosine-protein phosphatase [Enterococcus pseudoavium]